MQLSTLSNLTPMKEPTGNNKNSLFQKLNKPKIDFLIEGSSDHLQSVFDKILSFVAQIVFKHFKFCCTNCSNT